MVKPLVHDPFLLSVKSALADKSDKASAADLLDTLRHHSESCVGMAANMIGVRKRIIAFSDGGKYTLMYNPEITFKAAPFSTEEGCLSLLGEPRSVTRYKTINVKYLDESFTPRKKTYTGFTAQIIQHEIDHCDGILI